MLGRVLLVLLFALPAAATDIVFKRGTGASSGSVGGSGSCSSYVESTAATAGSTPSNTCDTWADTTNHTFKWSEDGLTEAWQGTPLPLCVPITNSVTISTAQDTFFARVPWDATVRNISCTTIGGTSAEATVSEYTSAAALSNVTEATITCDNDLVTTIDDPVLDRGDLLRLDIGTVTGVVTALMVCVEIEPR